MTKETLTDYKKRLAEKGRQPRQPIICLTVSILNTYDGGGVAFGGDIVGYIDDGSDRFGERVERHIGSWAATVLPLVDPVGVADSMASPEAYDAAMALRQSPPACLAEIGAAGNYMLVIDAVALVEDYRRHGFGRDTAREIIRTVGYGCKLVMLWPGPLGFTDDAEAPRAEAVRKLTRYWTTGTGFKPLGDPDGHLWLSRVEPNAWLHDDNEGGAI